MPGTELVQVMLLPGMDLEDAGWVEKGLARVVSELFHHSRPAYQSQDKENKSCRNEFFARR